MIRGRQRVLTGMLRYGVMVPYHEDPGFTRDHWRAYTTCRSRYGCLNVAEHELTRCHDGLTKDYHGVSRWYYGCTMTFSF